MSAWISSPMAASLSGRSVSVGFDIVIQLRPIPRNRTLQPRLERCRGAPAERLARGRHVGAAPVLAHGGARRAELHLCTRPDRSLEQSSDLANRQQLAGTE